MNSGEKPFRDTPIPDTREGFLERLRRDREMAPVLYARRKELRDSGVVLSCPGLMGGIAGTECVAIDAGDRVEFRRLFEEERLLFAIPKRDVTNVCVSTTPRPDQPTRMLQAAIWLSGFVGRRYAGWRSLVRATLGDGEDSFHVYFENGLDPYLAASRLASLFAHPATAHRPVAAQSLRQRLRQMWAVAEGVLPGEMEDVRKPRASRESHEDPAPRPALTPQLLSWREGIRQSGLPLYWLPEGMESWLPCLAIGNGTEVEFRRLYAEECLLFAIPKAAVVDVMAAGLRGSRMAMELSHALGLASLGRRIWRMVKLTAAVGGEVETVFFEARRAEQVDRVAARLRAICGLETPPR